MESLDPLHLDIILHTSVQGDFLTINLWKSRLYFKKCIVFLALFKEKSGKKERQKVPQESDGRRKKAFEGQSIPFSDKSCRIAFDEFAICPCP